IGCHSHRRNRLHDRRRLPLWSESIGGDFVGGRALERESPCCNAGRMTQPASEPAFNRCSCLYRKLDSATMVMKSAEDGRRYNVAHVLDGAMDRSVLVERPMSPQLIIVGSILRQNPA